MYVGDSYLGFGDIYGVEDGGSILTKTKVIDKEDAPGDIQENNASLVSDLSDKGNIGKGMLILIGVFILFSWKIE